MKLCTTCNNYAVTIKFLWKQEIAIEQNRGQYIILSPWYLALKRTCNGTHWHDLCFGVKINKMFVQLLILQALKNSKNWVTRIFCFCRNRYFWWVYISFNNCGGITHKQRLMVGYTRIKTVVLKFNKINSTPSAGDNMKQNLFIYLCFQGLLLHFQIFENVVTGGFVDKQFN